MHSAFQHSDDVSIRKSNLHPAGLGCRSAFTVESGKGDRGQVLQQHLSEQWPRDKKDPSRDINAGQTLHAVATREPKAPFPDGE